jgi:hypothetical protein
MAFEYLHLFHVLNENGDKTLVDYEEYAQRRLTGESLSQFLNDLNEASVDIHKNIDENKLIVTAIYEDLFTPDGESLGLQIGAKLTFVGATEKYQFHPKFDEINQTMKNDPNLTFNNGVWLDATP